MATNVAAVVGTESAISDRRVRAQARRFARIAIANLRRAWALPQSANPSWHATLAVGSSPPSTLPPGIILTTQDFFLPQGRGLNRDVLVRMRSFTALR